MAVSGRKATTASPVKTVSECWCDPCLTINQTVNAERFCNDCKEYLCITCLGFHSRMKASKHHHLQETIDIQYNTEEREEGKTQYSSLNFIRSVDVKTKSDEHSCGIVGCSYLSGNSIAIADRSNGTVKIVDINNDCITENVKLGDMLRFCCSELPQGDIAIAWNDTEFKWHFGTLKTNVNKSVGDCCNIVIIDGYFYVLRQNCEKVCSIRTNLSVQYRIEVLDSNGNRQYLIPVTPKFERWLGEEIDKKRDIFCYIPLAKYKEHIYISLPGLVARLCLEGSVNGKYTTSEPAKPSDMTVVGDGSLIVCCYKPFGTIHHVSGDLKPLHVWSGGFWLGIPWPSSICYHAESHCVCVGCDDSDEIKLFKLE